MKMRTIAFAAMIGCALGAGSASAQREAREQNVQQSSVTSVHAFVEKWQQRILNENLQVADPQNWAARSLPKLASFSAERLGLAMQAGSVGELEALMVSAPVANGTSLALLTAMKPGNISLDALSRQASQGAVTKFDPTTSPATYADLLFTSLNPCRMFDSRVSQGGAGPFVNAVARTIKVGPYTALEGGYATGGGAQGGSATGCGLDTLAAGSEVAAVMVAVTSFSQTGNGYLTFYSATTADPSLSVVSMFYQAGVLQTAFVVMPTDSVHPVYSRGISRNANTELTVDIVGYFAKPHALALECVNTAKTTVSVPAGSDGQAFDPACAAGFTKVGLWCETVNFDTVIAGFSPTFACSMHNNSGVARDISAIGRCCRVPGR